MTFWQRLKYSMVRPDDDPKEVKEVEIRPVEEIQADIARSNDKERAIGLVAAPVAIRSVRLGLHIAARAAGISDDPRYAAFGEALADAQLGHFRIDPPGIFSVRPCSITPRERYP